MRRTATTAMSSVMGVERSPRRLDQRLAQHLGVHAGVAPEHLPDPLLAELHLAVAGLGQPVGVDEQQVAPVRSSISRE